MKNKFSRLISVILIISMFLNCQFVYASSITNPIEYIKSKFNNETRLEDDYYTAINKEWIESIDLDSGRMSYGTFEELSNTVSENIKCIICDIKNNKDKYDNSSDEMKIVNLFENYVNIEEREKQGWYPVKKYIDKVKDCKKVEDIMDLFGDYEFLYFQSFINLGVGVDFRDSSKNILYISRSGLGLGNSEYYKADSDKCKKIRKEYKNYIKRLHRLIGENSKDAEKNSKSFYEFEDAIAQLTPSIEEEAADPDRIEKSYNVYSIEELKNFLCNINIDRILNNLNISLVDKVVVEDPEQLSKINDMICSENIDLIKNYVITSILISSDGILDKNFREASAGLKKALYGSDIDDINELEAVKFVNYELGGIIGRLYIEKYFDEQCKDDVKDMAKEIIENFQGRLENIQWMSDSTKSEAINKLKNVNVKIGYPDKWKNYDELIIRSSNEGGTLFENVMNIFVMEAKNQFDKLNREVNRDEWNMEPFVVNAYYNPINNEIVFPAGILQKPFYDHNASKECNLGGIGTVIGHELTHAFDTTGSQFDEQGNLKSWWKDEDYEEFLKRSKRISDYYSKIEMEEGRFVNGELTVGENISDLGGMACVLDIANKLEEPNLKELFENYAMIWRETSTEEMREYLLNNDPHAPKKIRVNVVLSQFEDFYKEYDIKEGDKMYVKNEERIGIW